MLKKNEKKIDQTVILNNTSEWKKNQNVTFTTEKNTVY